MIVITNQAGIGRGYYTETDFQRLNAWMLEQLRARGIEIARVYHCPYHPTVGIGEYRQDSFHRNPNPGMILDARDELGLNLSESALVGDKDSNIQAGRGGHSIEHEVIASGKHDTGSLQFPSPQQKKSYWRECESATTNQSVS